MGTDRVNINVGDGEQIKPDGAYLNDLREARSAQDLADAARTLRERAQGLVFDAASGQYRSTAPAASTTEREFTRTEVIGGREFTFTGPSESALSASIEGAKVAAAEFENAQARDDSGRFVGRNADGDDGGAEIARQTELELQFRRGEISVKEYIEQSGAVTEFLESQGVPLDELREVAGLRQAHAFEQDWVAATETFLAGPGGDWPGGNANKTNLQNALVALGLMDADDKVGALVQAYEYMKQNNALIPYEQANVSAAIQKELATASPEELIRVWREQYASGGDAAAANRALIESFRRK